MFNRPALLLAIGLTAASALSETFPKTFSTGLRRNPAPDTRSNTNISGRDVDPATCPTVKCAAGFRPVYQEGSKHCSCIDISAPCSNSIYCGAGCHSVTQPFRDTCACEPDAGTETCPMMKCKAEHHVVFHNETGTCSCSSDCPDLFCIAEMQPVYNSSTYACSCEIIPGLNARLEPTATPQEIASALSLAVEDFSSKTTLKQPYTGPPTKRQEISTATRAFITTSVASRPIAIPQEIASALSLAAEQFSSQTTLKQPYTGPPTKRQEVATATRAFITTTVTPRPIAIPQEIASALSLAAEDFSSQTTLKQPYTGPFTKRQEIATATRAFITTSAAPQPTSFNPLPGMSCLKMVCIAEMHPVYNTTSGDCSCKYISGLEPGGPVLSAREKIPTFTTSTIRSPKPTSCPEHNIMCEVGKQPGWNVKNGTCECQLSPKHSDPPSSTTVAPLPPATA